MKINRRKLGGGLLLGAGIILFIVPFLFPSPSQPAATTPPPTSGNNHGGNKGGGGSSPPPCTGDCKSSPDTQPPMTTIQMTGSIEWPRGNVTYFYPNVTVTIHAVDDENLTSITLNDNGTTTNFTAQGRSSTSTKTLTTIGLHKLSYYSTDKAGNKEKSHNLTVGLNKPDLSDIKTIIMNSNIDNPGIKNALIAKLSAAQAQIDASQKPNALSALLNQLNALDGKHGLDQVTSDLIETMILTNRQ